VVGECLLWTLGQGLGEEFTVDVQDAWAAAYGVLSAAMINAQRSLEAESPL
jgi:nitric oxide dioxygenase